MPTIEQQYGYTQRPYGLYPTPNFDTGTQEGSAASRQFERNEGKEKVKYWASNEQNSKVYLKIIEELIKQGEKLLREPCKEETWDKLNFDKAKACFLLAEELNQIYNSWNVVRHPKAKITWQSDPVLNYLPVPRHLEPKPTKSDLETGRTVAIDSISKIREKEQYQCLFQIDDDFARKFNLMIESLIKCFNPEFKCTLFKSGPSTTEKMLKSGCLQAENIVNEQFTQTLTSPNP